MGCTPHTHTYTHTYTHAHIQTHIYTHTYTLTRLPIPTLTTDSSLNFIAFSSALLCDHTPVYPYTYITPLIYTSTNIHTHIHTYIHTYIHTHTHTHTLYITHRVLSRSADNRRRNCEPLDVITVYGCMCVWVYGCKVAWV